MNNLKAFEKVFEAIQSELDELSQSYYSDPSYYSKQLKELDEIFEKYDFEPDILTLLNTPFYINSLKGFEKLRDLMIKIRSVKVDDTSLMRKIMQFWAKKTGNFEDEVISDELLFDLLEKGYITQEEFDIYDNAKATNRWR